MAFVMLEIGELSMHVNARGPTETHLSTPLEILRIKEQKMDHLPLLRTSNIASPGLSSLITNPTYLYRKSGIG